MQGSAARDKDYSFARLCDLKSHVTFKMCVFPKTPGLDLRYHSVSWEGDLPKRTYTEVLDNPELSFEGLQSE